MGLAMVLIHHSQLISLRWDLKAAAARRHDNREMSLLS
jgi:hypothetical protein